VAAKSKQLPAIEQRDAINGIVHAYDRNGRLCLDSANPVRIVLVQDLRVYGESLHIGALGWTAPETTDGYKEVDVQFDTGKRLRLKRYAFERVAVEAEHAVSARLMSQYKNTRFDADPEVAASCRTAWIATHYGPFMSLDQTVIQGEGDQELYAYTFPSLKELAGLKIEPWYPVKVGYSQNSSDGAYGRIRSQILEKAAYPEKPEVLCVWRTWDGRSLEKQVHQRLRSIGRKVLESLGREWFTTSTAELCQVTSQCELVPFPAQRAVCGADETIEEGFSALMAQGATIEMRMLPGQAAVSIGIRYSKETNGDDGPV
jgi:hypothetical protein